MKMNRGEIDAMLSEIADGLRAGNEEVYMFLHEQFKSLSAEDTTALAMGVIAHLMPNFPFAEGRLH
jgi:hypothetical protein